MEIIKLGENYEIKSTTDKYVVSGNVIKTVKGDAGLTITITKLDGTYLATVSGDYRVSEGRIQMNLNAPIEDYADYVAIMKDIIDTVRTILN